MASRPTRSIPKSSPPGSAQKRFPWMHCKSCTSAFGEACVIRSHRSEIHAVDSQSQLHKVIAPTSFPYEAGRTAKPSRRALTQLSTFVAHRIDTIIRFIPTKDALLVIVTTEPERCDLQRRAYATLVGHGDHLYLLGGGDGTTCFSSVECFSTQTNEWFIVAPLETARGSLGAEVRGVCVGVRARVCKLAGPTWLRVPSRDKQQQQQQQQRRRQTTTEKRAPPCRIIGELALHCGTSGGYAYARPRSHARAHCP